jgi:hypothetical protein
MSDGGGCGQQLVMRQEIYFPGHREHSPEYPGVYLDIQAGLLRFIMRNPSARGILANRHGMLPSRLDAWLPPVRGRADRRRRSLADRRADVRIGRAAAAARGQSPRPSASRTARAAA